MKSKNPFEAFVPDNSKQLIIGTIPPPRFCKEPYPLQKNDVNFFYGSRDNYFWLILEEICNTKLDYTNSDKAIQQRKDLLEKLNIGITDIVGSCIHTHDSAVDKDLCEIEFKNIKTILQEFPSINTLIYTSEYVKKLVNNQYGTRHSIDRSDNKRQSVRIGGKLYQVKILYSPSPMALINMGENGVEKRKEQYRAFLTKN